MEQKFIKLFERFLSIQTGKYLQQKGKEIFDSPAEEEMVEKTVREGWNEYIESKKEDLLSMSERSIVNFFEAIELNFPHYKKRDDDVELFDEDRIDEDDFEELDEEDIEELNDELNRLADELESIPEDERQDVVMLMLAFPALQEVGFPISIFMGGDGNVQLNETQRQQIDWARQLAYKIVDMADESDVDVKKEKYDHVKEFAAAFIRRDKIDNVIEEIRNAYERGDEFG